VLQSKGLRDQLTVLKFELQKASLLGCLCHLPKSGRVCVLVDHRLPSSFLG
jgi:hypothetical protein